MRWPSRVQVVSGAAARTHGFPSRAAVRPVTTRLAVPSGLLLFSWDKHGGARAFPGGLGTLRVKVSSASAGPPPLTDGAENQGGSQHAFGTGEGGGPDAALFLDPILCVRPTDLSAW